MLFSLNIFLFMLSTRLHLCLGVFSCFVSCFTWILPFHFSFLSALLVWSLFLLPQPWQSACSRPLKMASWIYVNSLLNQTGSLWLLSSPSCTCLYVMVPVLLRQGSALPNAAACCPIYFRMGQTFLWRPLSFNQWLQKDLRSNEAHDFKDYSV